MNRFQNGTAASAASRPEAKPNEIASDAELVQAARLGDKRAFVAIVARHQAMVCGIALSILGDFATSEDAGQEAFLTAWRKLPELREPQRLRAWLSQIARNAALGHLRRYRGHDPLEHAPDLPDELPTPDQAAVNEEEAALVRASLAKLPEIYRQPLILFYRDGQSVRGVAEALAISEDAVKQRLSRGREMLRERMSGLIENVLTRTGPTPLFTVAVAVAIGALATPVSIASSAFAVGAALGTPAATTSTFLTAMNTSKAFLVVAACVTAVCIPIGYRLRAPAAMSVPPPAPAAHVEFRVTPPPPARPGYESSALFAQWKQLHDTYGTTAEAMPEIYHAITGLKDSFRRRALRAALIAEWVQLDPANGLEFFLHRGNDSSQRHQFFDEWLARDARAAVDGLLASGRGWEGLARDALTDIAKSMPGRVPEIVARLPKSSNYWDSKVRDAFAIVAEGGLASTRAAAEAMEGPNREQALAGVAMGWAKSDLTGAVAWAKKLPEGTDRDEIIRAALVGRAAADPVSALENAGLVPPGGRQGYFASTTGARILREAAQSDFDTTASWLAAHPGRFAREELLGLANSVTERLNADAAGFLSQYAAAGSLAAMVPAIESALLNDGAGQRTAVWDWLKSQPESQTTKALQNEVLSSAGFQDPALAMRLVADLPRTTAAEDQVQTLARCIINGGRELPRFEKLYDQAPERMRRPLLEAAFGFLNVETLNDPKVWIQRLSELPEPSLAQGINALARSWGGQAPEAAIRWATALPEGASRAGALANIAGSWSAKDLPGASAWVAAMAPGAERDQSAQVLAAALSEAHPREAWDWAVSIEDATARMNAATAAARSMAAHDPDTARQWIESAPFAPEVKASMQASVAASVTSFRPRK